MSDTRQALEEACSVPRHIAEAAANAVEPTTSAARIQALETSLAEANASQSVRIAEARRQALEEAAKACEAERLSEPQDESDAAYDNAIDHCVEAIRALAEPLLDRQGDGKEEV